MAITIPEVWRTQIERLHLDERFVWLWEIEADQSSTARTIFRVVADVTQVLVPFFRSSLEALGDDGDPTGGGVLDGTLGALDGYTQDLMAPQAIFYPLPMKQSAIELQGDGSLPTMTLTLDNTARVLTRWFQKGEGFVNKRVVAYMGRRNDLSFLVPFVFRVAGAAVSMTEATMRLEMPNWFKRDLPEDRFDARRCRHAFGGPLCGYVLNSVAAYSTCAKHVADCILRGDDMVARNLPRLQPLRFGAFAGVPTS